MGVSERFSIAFAKAQLASGVVLPESGNIFISVSARHKDQIAELAQRLVALGFNLLATQGTAKRLEEQGIAVQRVKKLAEGHPNLVDHLKNEGRIRAAAVQHGVPCITTIQAAIAAVMAMEALREEEMNVESLQERFAL